MAKRSSQLTLPGMNRTPKSKNSPAAKAKKADIVLVQALEAHSTRELEAAIDILRPLKDAAGYNTAYTLMCGVLAYRIARTAKQESFL